MNKQEKYREFILDNYGECNGCSAIPIEDIHEQAKRFKINKKEAEDIVLDLEWGIC